MFNLNFKLPEGWYKADEEESERLKPELAKEVIPGHPMHSVAFNVVAHRDGATDDILCMHSNENLFTVVHLTWNMKSEIDINHPTIECHGTFEEFLKYENNC